MYRYIVDADCDPCLLVARLCCIHNNCVEEQVYLELTLHPFHLRTMWRADQRYAVRELGLGTDIWALPFDNITLIFKALYCLFVLYITSRHLVRGSILLFHHRLFGHERLARRLVQFSFVILIAFGVTFDFAILVGCAPIEHFWLSWDNQHRGHCISTHAIFWAGAFIDIAIDIWIMLIPIPFIVRLKLSLRKRILTGIMFAFGLM